MSPADPTYPLYPIACILASTGISLVLLTSFIRQNWNLGVAFLCFWLFIENLVGGINAVIWSDNAEVKLYVYCDIVSRVGVVTYVVKPMATLIITRRLYLIASLQSVELPSSAARRRNLILEWTLGLFIPLLVAGPLYYINEDARFQILEGSGCGDTAYFSILNLLVLQSWAVTTPFLSLIIYYPRIALMLYRRRQDVNHFLHSSKSVKHTSYLRILILASLDILFTLPIGITNIVLNVTEALQQGYSLPFYPGWAAVHASWEPVSIPYAVIQAAGTSTLVEFYLIRWTSPVLSFVVFGLFGLTEEARASYWRFIGAVISLVGLKPDRVQHAPSTLEALEFSAGPEVSLDAEMGRPDLSELSLTKQEKASTDNSSTTSPDSQKSESLYQVSRGS